MRGSYVFSCSSRISFNPTSHLNNYSVDQIDIFSELLWVFSVFKRRKKIQERQ